MHRLKRGPVSERVGSLIFGKKTQFSDTLLEKKGKKLVYKIMGPDKINLLSIYGLRKKGQKNSIGLL